MKQVRNTKPKYGFRKIKYVVGLASAMLASVSLSTAKPQTVHADTNTNNLQDNRATGEKSAEEELDHIPDNPNSKTQTPSQNQTSQKRTVHIIDDSTQQDLKQEKPVKNDINKQNNTPNVNSKTQTPSQKRTVHIIDDSTQQDLKQEKPVKHDINSKNNTPNVNKSVPDKAVETPKETPTKTVSHVDNKTVDNKTVDNKTVDNKTVDNKTVDNKTVQTTDISTAALDLKKKQIATKLVQMGQLSNNFSLYNTSLFALNDDDSTDQNTVLPNLTNDAYALNPTNNLHEHANVNVNGGYDENTWGTLDVSKWQGSIQGNYYQLTGYDGNTNNIIVPNQADFEKAGISTAGKQVGITSDFMKSLALNATRIGLSKTNNEKIGASDSNWSNTFGNLTNLTQMDLHNLDTHNVIDMGGMFTNASGLTTVGDLSNWNTGNVTNMSNMFNNASGLTNIGNLSHWNTGNVTTMEAMFNGASSLTNIGNLDNWNTGNVQYMGNMFYNASNLTNIGNLDNWNTGNDKDIGGMFQNASSLTNIGNLSHWNTGNVTTMANMFNGASGLTNIGNLDNWNTGNVTNMAYMFANASGLTNIGHLDSWNTGNVTTMANMFNNASSLTNIGDLSHWQTGNVTNMEAMFQNASKLTNIGNLDNWNTGNVTNMFAMFDGASDLTNKMVTLSNKFSQYDSNTIFPKLTKDNWQDPASWGLQKTNVGWTYSLPKYVADSSASYFMDGNGNKHEGTTKIGLKDLPSTQGSSSRGSWGSYRTHINAEINPNTANASTNSDVLVASTPILINDPMAGMPGHVILPPSFSFQFNMNHSVYDKHGNNIGYLWYNVEKNNDMKIYWHNTGKNYVDNVNINFDFDSVNMDKTWPDTYQFQVTTGKEFDFEFVNPDSTFSTWREVYNPAQDDHPYIDNIDSAINVHIGSVWTYWQISRLYFDLNQSLDKTDIHNELYHKVEQVDAYDKQGNIVKITSAHDSYFMTFSKATDGTHTLDGFRYDVYMPLKKLADNLTSQQVYDQTPAHSMSYSMQTDGSILLGYNVSPSDAKYNEGQVRDTVDSLYYTNYQHPEDKQKWLNATIDAMKKRNWVAPDISTLSTYLSWDTNRVVTTTALDVTPNVKADIQKDTNAGNTGGADAAYLQTATLNFIDDDDHDKVISHQLIMGPQDKTKQFWTNVPDDYVLTNPNQIVISHHFIYNDKSIIDIHVKHKIIGTVADLNENAHNERDYLINQIKSHQVKDLIDGLQDDSNKDLDQLSSNISIVQDPDQTYTANYNDDADINNKLSQINNDYIQQQNDILNQLKDWSNDAQAPKLELHYHNDNLHLTKTSTYQVIEKMPHPTIDPNKYGSDQVILKTTITAGKDIARDMVTGETKQTKFLGKYTSGTVDKGHIYGDDYSAIWGNDVGLPGYELDPFPTENEEHFDLIHPQGNWMDHGAVISVSDSGNTINFDYLVGQGYHSDVTMSDFPDDQTWYVTMHPLAQHVNIVYVDNDTNETVKTTPLQGVTDEQINLTYEAPANYTIAPDQSLPNNYLFTASDNSDIDVWLNHATQPTTQTHTAKRIFKLQFNGQDIKHDYVQTGTITITGNQDLLTGDSDNGNYSLAQWNEVTKEDLIKLYQQYGYQTNGHDFTLDGNKFTTINAVEIDPDTQDETHIINVVPDQRPINYIDIATNNTVASDSVQGVANAVIKYAPNVPDGYELLTPQDSYNIPILGDNTPFDIYVKSSMIHIDHTKPHHQGELIYDDTQPNMVYPNNVDYDDLNQTITRTINIYEPDGVITQIVQKVVLYRDADYDLSHHITTYTPWQANGTRSWDSYTAPDFDGYTPDLSYISAATPLPDSQDITINIHYKETGSEVVLAYNDIDESGTEVARYNEGGKPNSTIQIDWLNHMTQDMPGYEIVPGQVINGQHLDDLLKNHASLTYALSDVNKPIVINIRHIDSDVTNTDPKAKSSSERTLTIIEPNGHKIVYTQHIDFIRTATRDQATGLVSYGDWHVSGGYESDTNGGYTAINANNNSTYTVDSINIPAFANYETQSNILDNKGNTLTNPNTDNILPSITVSPDSPTRNYLVTYHKMNYDYFGDNNKQHVDSSHSGDGSTNSQISNSNKVDSNFVKNAINLPNYTPEALNKQIGNVINTDLQSVTKNSIKDVYHYVPHFAPTTVKIYTYVPHFAPTVIKTYQSIPTFGAKLRKANTVNPALLGFTQSKIQVQKPHNLATLGLMTTMLGLLSK